MINTKIKEVNGVSGLESIRGEWQKLTTKMDRRRFFHQWAWYDSYLRNLSDHPDSVHFILFFENDEPSAILPYVKGKEKKNGITFNTLSLPLHPHLNLSDIIISRQPPGYFSKTIVPFLKSKKGLKWDFFRVAKLLEESPIIKQMTSADAGDNFSRKVATSAYVKCNQDDPHTNKLSAKFKRNLRRLLKRAKTKGDISWHYISDKGDLPEAYQDFLKAEASGWKGEEGTETAIKLNPNIAGFYASLIDGFSETGQCQINVLKIGDECVASQFCLINEGILHILKIGYDEAYNDVAPGSLLLIDLIDHCVDDAEIHTISFVTGPPWTTRWHVESHNVYETIIFNQSVKGGLASQLYKLKNFVDSRMSKETTS